MAKVETPKTQEKQPRQSTEKPSIWELGGLTWGQLLKRVWTDMDTEHDDTLGRAAELAYYFFLAVFPALLFLFAILGTFVGSNSAISNTLFQYISAALPPDAAKLLHNEVKQATQAAGGWKLLVGIVGALWSASSGTSSLMTVLNFAYNVKERRPWWKSRLIYATLLTIALATLVLIALAIFLFGDYAASWAGSQGLGYLAVIAWRIVQWPLAIFFVSLAFAILYYWGPDIHDQKWYWITPGSLIGVGLWISGTILFRVYLHFFNSYSATYGSVGAVAILMLWFYLTSLTLLIGAEMNAEIENSAAEHGRADAKLKGEKQAPAA